MIANRRSPLPVDLPRRRSDLAVEEFAPDDSRLADFEALPERPYPQRLPEPVNPGARCLLIKRGGEVVARLSWECVEALRGAPGPVGIIGHYEALEASAGIALLCCARERLVAAGLRHLIGPMNGSTWARYRLALPPEPGDAPDEPPFLTEPQNPAGYPEQFEAAGFSVAVRYESRIVTELPATRPGAAALAARVEAARIRVRPLARERLEQDLRSVFLFSQVAFAGNPFFRAIEWEAFHAQYAGFERWLDPGLVLLANGADGAMVGFLFAIPDLLSPPDSRRAVLKTFASSPGGSHPGVATHLADELHRIAYEKGYGAVIHALMHVDNPSVRISKQFGSRPFRRYALYEYQFDHRRPTAADAR